MKSLLIALSVVVAALAFAVAAFSATGNNILETEHAGVHLEQIGPKYLPLERAGIVQTDHAGVHLEQIGPKFLPGP